MIRHRSVSRCHLLVFALLSLGIGPCGPIPGGELSGDAWPDPVADWSFSNEHSRCQVEMRPEDPYSITANCTEHSRDLYLGCLECSEKKWPAFLTDDPRARVRINGLIYPVRALRVEDDAVIAQVWDARSLKYDDGRVGDVPEDYAVYLLESAP